MKTHRPRLVCTCGSRKFKTSMTLELHDVPVWLGRTGTLTYDDTKGTSCGWDPSVESEINCARCGHTYELEQTGEDKKGRPKYELRDWEVSDAG